MKELLLIAGTVAAAMGLVAASVVVGGDTTTLVSPPGVVAKEFVRQLAAGRYDRAAAHLADSRGGRETAEAEGNRLRARGSPWFAGRAPGKSPAGPNRVSAPRRPRAPTSRSRTAVLSCPAGPGRPPGDIAAPFRAER